MFQSETDTKDIAKLTQQAQDRYSDTSFRKLVKIVIQQLEGAFALAFKLRKFSGQLVASRRGSPLLVGIKSSSRLQTKRSPVSYSKVASAMSAHAKQVLHLEDDDVAFVEDGALGGIKEHLHDIKRCRRLIMVACGTSYNSAIACRQVLEELSELPVVLELASDFLDRQTPIFRDDVCIFVSQSGETADTLMALRYCKPRGALLIGITNTVGFSICRESHCGIHINAGPEIGVASTKAYTSQILALLMFALSLSDDRISLTGRRQEIIDAMKKLPDFINEILALEDEVLQIAKDIYKEKSLLIMGRGFNFATCLEGALKIKELSYMHCEGIMSGELKHGPLAMVDEKLRICMIVCNYHVYKKSLNALQQVVARGGAPIIIADQSVSIKDLAGMNHILRVPKTVDCVQNKLTVIPLQLLAFHIAELNGQNVDRPRNLAKSVTVE